jgi:hypothetical protein
MAARWASVPPIMPAPMSAIFVRAIRAAPAFLSSKRNGRGIGRGNVAPA